MRAVIFTLDSIFALIIAAAGISLLAYFFYTPQTTTVLGYSSAASILQNLLSTNSSAISSSNFLFSSIAYQANASNEAWDSFMRDSMHNAGNPHGPLTPLVSFIYHPSSGTPSRAVADYGKIFFYSGSILYALSATSGATAWTKNIGQTPPSQPIISSGLLIYSNTMNLTAINPVTNTIAWSSPNALVNPAMTSNFLAYGNKLYYGSGTNVLAVYAANGTQAWSYSLGSAVNSIVADSGSLAASYASSIALLNDFGSSGNVIWSKPIGAGVSSLSSSPYNGIIGFLSGSTANAVYVDNSLASGFPYAIVAGSAYPTIYNNTLIYQSSNAIIAVSTNGLLLWTYSAPAAYGTATANNYPVATSKMIYSTWSNGYLVALNYPSGTFAWATNVPYGSPLILSGVAYGRLYATSGANVIAFGTCNAGGGGSLLAMAATMYANGQGSCADALVDSVYPMTNYSIFLNSTFAPAMSLASFNGLGSFIENPTKAPLNGLQTFTISAWVYPTNTANGPYIYSEGSPSLSMDFGVTPGNALTISTTNSGTPETFTSSLSVPLNKWSFVTAELSVGGTSGTFVLSLNGQLQSGAGQPESTAGAMFSGIGYSVGNTVGQAGSFFSGNIANVQIYNATLSQSQILQIYQRGLQGAPLQNVGIQAWYPLAGDSNDYSGLGNTAYPFGVSYLSSNYLPSGYTNSYQVSSAGITLPIQNYTTGLSRLYKVGVVAWR